ncbi:interleukin-3 [Pteropus medius]|uniref:interleukin-3-like n=1 Tax=Pteropus vampyrus TaxID=132908 RepID=UPI00196B1AFA|nr:interleukin-3-like [Pteropus giganteus]
MSSLPILHLLLLLLTAHAPQAQGLPLPTSSTKEYVNMMMREIESILNKLPLPPQEPLDVNEIHILNNEAFLMLNLDTFLEATKNLQDKGMRIGKILEKLKETISSAPMTTEEPIYIKKGNWDDFWRKMTKYLNFLQNYLKKS